MITVETVSAAGYGLVTGGLMLAQATDILPSLPGISGVDVGQVASMGFAVWYGWYTTSIAIPRIIAQHAAQEKEKDLSHDRQIAALTESFRAELKDIREGRERDRERFRCSQDPSGK